MSDADQMQHADKGENVAAEFRSDPAGHDCQDQEFVRLLQTIEGLAPLLSANLATPDPAVRRLLLKGCLDFVRELSGLASRIVEREEAEFSALVARAMAGLAS